MRPLLTLLSLLLILGCNSEPSADPASSAVKNEKIEQKRYHLPNLIPVIKSANYPEEVAARAGNTNKPSPPVSEKYNNELLILYVQDPRNSTQYLTEDDLKKLDVPKDSLRAIAVRNLYNLQFNRRIGYRNGVYEVAVTGDHAGSFILLPEFWNEKDFPVKGDYIIAVPNKELLMITGSEDKAGIDKLKAFIAKSYKTVDYTISEHLFKRTGEKFERFD